MNTTRTLALAAMTLASLGAAQPACAQRSAYQAMVVAHARANNVPEALVHRVIMRESKYQAHLVGRGATMGLMQIKLPTARGVGYRGDARGLLDPETNIAYGVRYLAGAWRISHGSHDAVVMHYARGYYRRGLPPMRYAALPLAKPSDAKPDAISADTAAVDGTPVAAIDRNANAQVSPQEAASLRVPMPRPRPQLAEDVPAPSDPLNALARFWDEVTRSMPAH